MSDESSASNEESESHDSVEDDVAHRVRTIYLRLYLGWYTVFLKDNKVPSNKAPSHHGIYIADQPMTALVAILPMGNTSTKAVIGWSATPIPW